MLWSLFKKVFPGFQVSNPNPSICWYFTYQKSVLFSFATFETTKIHQKSPKKLIPVPKDGEVEIFLTSWLMPLEVSSLLQLQKTPNSNPASVSVFLLFTPCSNGIFLYCTAAAFPNESDLMASTTCSSRLVRWGSSCYNDSFLHHEIFPDFFCSGDTRFLIFF